MKKWSEFGGGLSVVARSGAAKDAARRRLAEEYRERRRVEETSDADENFDGSNP
jgi:hypothetical protein